MVNAALKEGATLIGGVSLGTCHSSSFLTYSQAVLYPAGKSFF